MISLSKYKQKTPISDSLEESFELVNDLLDSYERHDNKDWQLIFSPKLIEK